MAIQLAAAVTSFVICFLIIPVIVKYSLEKNLVDIPGRRKIHKKITPSMGGIAIFLGFFIASLIWVDIAHWKEIRFIMIALFMVFFIGVRDDLIPLRPTIKLVGQILTSSLLILLFDFRLKSLYGLLGIYDIPILVSYGITLFTFVVITNSFNLIDGLDGLAGTIASISLLAFGVSFFLAGDNIYSIISFCMLGAVIAFLFFNWEPSEIFMGDTGALVIGMIISILAIHFIELHHSLPISNPYRVSACVSGAICFILIPLADTLRVFILRVTKKQSPFTPDKNHIHHYILRLGFSHSKSTIFLGIVQVIFIVVFLLLQNINDNYLLMGILTFCTILGILLNKIIKGKLIKDNS
jgi:UDP-N-acetylmuramyl pentapeptide phosphotransferase/UDP-N-acetylglucosamine-1-phosphate transferase